MADSINLSRSHLMSQDALFERDIMDFHGIWNPHTCFHGYNSFEKSDKLSMIKNCTPKNGAFNSTERLPLPDTRFTRDVEHDWDRAEEAFLADFVWNFKFESDLDMLARQRFGINEVLLLGMGTPHHEKHGELAVQQYVLAHRVITAFLQKFKAGWMESMEFRRTPNWEQYKH
ncbi:hypothetical protein GQ44DRAFT_723929 [Phaeosphaeriaceae sp. PMI808]|nr:hypothetical protein GQ44DRAFT_723929 [Phaeosphaeriaceae sp. PMI808]